MKTTRTHFAMDVWLTNGHRATYLQANALLAQHKLEHIQPDRFFTQPSLIIAGADTMIAYPCAAIEQVDFITETLPKWTFHNNVRNVWQITEEEYQQACKEEARRPRRRAISPLPGDIQTLYNTVEMTSGRIVYQEVQLNLEPPGRLTPVDLNLFIQHLFSGPSLYSRWRQGGATLINPSNVVRFAWHPFLLEPPKNTWPASQAALPEKVYPSSGWFG